MDWDWICRQVDAEPHALISRQPLTLIRRASNDGACVHGRALECLLDILEMQREVTAIGEFALRYRLYESSLLGRMTLARLASRTSRASERRAQYVAALAGNEALKPLRGPRIAGAWAVAADVAVRSWAESSRCLQDLCRARSIHYVHALQPTLFDDGSKVLAPSEIATQGNNRAYIDGVHALYPRLREAGRGLREHGVNFHDCSMAFAELREPVYTDHCHFKDAGNEIVAARIAEAFLQSLPSAIAPSRARTRR